ncbi:MAG: response regulator [Armatimonadota bacterium]
MVRILFVDDDPCVLQGLERLLHNMRNEWEMHFVQSAKEGLDLVSQSDYDVVVSDIQMPEMDGIQFLSELKIHHPRIVRIALSGHAERRAIIKSLGYTHRFLSKPCEPDTLKSTVTTACALRDLLDSEHLREVVTGMDVLPSSSIISQELNKELEKPEPSIARIGATIEKDPAITAKILQMSNSAFFGVRQRVSDAAQAVSILGIDSIKMLLSITEVFSSFASKKTNAVDIEQIYEHSLRVGSLVRVLLKAERFDVQATEETIASGLLHDIGKLVLAWKSPDDYHKAMNIAKSDDCHSYSAEKAVFNATHAEVGAYLLGLWGLPETIVEIIAFHHKLDNSGATTFNPLIAVHFADAYDHAANGHNLENYLDMEYLMNIGLTERIPQWRDSCDELQLI